MSDLDSIIQNRFYTEDSHNYRISGCITLKLNEWTQKANFLSTSSNACVSFVYNNNIYVGAGFAVYDFSAEFWKNNPETDEWKKINSFPGQRRTGGVLCASSERVFYGTGYWTLTENDWWEYFPETDSWEKRKSMPDKGRINGVALSVNNRYFVSTGRYFAGI